MKLKVLVGILAIVIGVMVVMFSGPLENNSSADNGSKKTDIQTKPEYTYQSFNDNAKDFQPWRNSDAINNPKTLEDDGAELLYSAISLLENQKDNLELIKQALAKFDELSAEEKEKLRALLNEPEMQKIVSLLFEASTKGSVSWDVDYSKGFEVELPHLGSIRNFSQLLSLKSLLDGDSGDYASAKIALNNGLRLNALCNDNNFMISELINISSTKQYFLVLDKFREQVAADNSTYELLEKQLLNRTNEQLKSLDGERVLGVDSLFARAFGDFDKFKTDFNITGDYNTDQLQADYQRLTEKSLKIRAILDAESGNYREEIQKINEEYSNISEKSQLYNLLDTDTTQQVEQYLKQQSQMRLQLIALKLESYKRLKGSYPNSLEELNLPKDILIDKLTNKPYNFVDGRLTSEFNFGKGGPLSLKVFPR